MSENLTNRMIRAMKLDSSLYEEVERDETAMNQAITVVVISSLCAGVGSLLNQMFKGRFGVFGLITVVISALIGWLIWSYITYFIGTRLFKGAETSAEYGELLRTIGFSNSPGVFNIFNFIPLVSLIVGIWQLASMIIAVRQALDFDTTKAILTCIVGWIAYIIIAIVLGGLMALPALM